MESDVAADPSKVEDALGPPRGEVARKDRLDVPAAKAAVSEWDKHETRLTVDSRASEHHHTQDTGQESTRDKDEDRGSANTEAEASTQEPLKPYQLALQREQRQHRRQLQMSGPVGDFTLVGPPSPLHAPPQSGFKTSGRRVSLQSKAHPYLYYLKENRSGSCKASNTLAGAKVSGGANQQTLRMNRPRSGPAHGHRGDRNRADVGHGHRGAVITPGRVRVTRPGSSNNYFRGGSPTTARGASRAAGFVGV